MKKRAHAAPDQYRREPTAANKRLAALHDANAATCIKAWVALPVSNCNDVCARTEAHALAYAVAGDEVKAEDFRIAYHVLSKLRSEG